MRRRDLLATLAVPALPAAAQGRVHRLGILSPGQLSIDGFRRWAIPELAREGFVEGRNLEIVARSAEGDPARLRLLAGEILAARPDVALAVSNPAAHAIRALNQAIPIVMGFAGTDPVADGLALSLARPGGSVTGTVMLAEELDVKRVELVRNLLPEARRIGFLAGATFTEARIAATVDAAHGLGLSLVPVRAAGPDTHAAAFAALEAAGVQALVIGSFPAFATHAADLVARARAARLPTVCEWRSMAEAGCLLALGPVNAELRRRAAHFIARILRGEPPGAIPMERADRFETVVNLRTARELGLELSPLLLAAAEEVIE